jgi:hypothetical protein
MPEIKYADNVSPAQRIQNRLRSSSPAQAKDRDCHISPLASTETVPNRTITNTYFSGAVRQHGEVNRGEGRIAVTAPRSGDVMSRRGS